MTQEAPHPTPKDLATQFITAIEMIGRTPAITKEDDLENQIGGGIIIRGFGLGFPDRAVPEAFAEQIRYKLHHLLERSPVTTSYRTYIEDMVNGQLESGMMRMMGPDLIVETAGINLKGEKYGMFDPQHAQQSETAALKQAAYMAGSSMIEELAAENWRKVDAWAKDYRVKYNTEPEI